MDLIPEIIDLAHKEIKFIQLLTKDKIEIIDDFLELSDIRYYTYMIGILQSCADLDDDTYLKCREIFMSSISGENNSSILYSAFLDWEKSYENFVEWKRNNNNISQSKIGIQYCKIRQVFRDITTNSII